MQLDDASGSTAHQSAQSHHLSEESDGDGRDIIRDLDFGEAKSVGPDDGVGNVACGGTSDVGNFLPQLRSGEYIEMIRASICNGLGMEGFSD